MIRHSTTAVAAIFAIFLVSSEAYSQVVSSTNLTCSKSRRLQSAINSVPAGTVGTIVVSGTCNENIVVPRGKTIVIRAANASATLTAANNLQPALRSHGDTTIQGMRVINAAGTAEALVMADRTGFVNLIGASLSAPNVESVVGIYGQSGGRIVNSRVVGGTISAVEVWDGSGARIVGTPAEAAGPDGSKVVMSSPNGTALSCGDGSSVAVRANKTNSNEGSVLINNSRGGVGGLKCTATLVNNATLQSNFLISGIAEAAISASASSVQLTNIAIQNNANDGINVNMSDVDISGSLFSDNSTSDITANTFSRVVIWGWGGKSTSFTNIGTGNKFNCWADSKIYMSQSDVVQDISGLPDLPTCVVVQ